MAKLKTENRIPFEPEPLFSLQARYADAIAETFVLPPGLVRQAEVSAAAGRLKQTSGYVAAGHVPGSR